SPSHEEARKRLLEEGARCYLDAITAMIEFQREVRRICRGVIEKYLGEYASALKLKVPFHKSEIRDGAWPSFPNWEGDWWTLGVEIPRRDIPKVPWWGAYCALSYEAPARGLYCFIGEWSNTTQFANGLYRKFRRLNQNLIKEDNEVWISHSLNVEEVPSFG